MNIKIAIVLPVFNGQKYIRECLDSLLAQDYPCWDAFIVNDGSNDNSLKILNEYADKDRRFHVYSKENGGAASARNYAMSKIERDKNVWVSFVDIDDYVSTQFFSSIISALAPLEDDVDFVRQYLIKTYTRDVKKNNLLRNPQNNYIVSSNDYFLTQNVAGMICSTFIRYSLIYNNGFTFPENMKVLEDQSFVIPCALRAKNILIFNEAQGYYYFIGNMQSVTHSLKNHSKDIINCCNIVYNNFYGGGYFNLIDDYFYKKFLPIKMKMLINTLFANIKNGASCNLSTVFEFKVPKVTSLIEDKKILVKLIILRLLHRI